MYEKRTMCLILMAAGTSSRFNHLLPFDKKIKKQWLRIGTLPLWKKVLEDLRGLNIFDEIIIGIDGEYLQYAKNFCENGEKLISGGASRAQTLRNALRVTESEFVFVSDVARFRIDEKICWDLLKQSLRYDCVVPYIECVDTIYYGVDPIDRTKLKMIQTPQISNTKKLKVALQKGDYTDESTAMLDCSFSVGFVKGSAKMDKLTVFEDISKIPSYFCPSTKISIGHGIDIHKFEEGKVMYLGGLEIESAFGFKAHSDGDVLLHALIDALLGAVGGGDIGEWFSDCDAKYKDIDSKTLLEKIRMFIVEVGYEILHIDISILAQVPKFSFYKKALQESIAKLLLIPKYYVNIKATTAEEMGFIGRKEGICVHANATLKFLNWREI